MSVASLLATFAGTGVATEITDRKTLTLDGARRAIAAAVAQAHKNHAGGVIAVVDDGGNLMALERVDGTFAAGANISIGKAVPPHYFKSPRESSRRSSRRAAPLWLRSTTSHRSREACPSLSTARLPEQWA
jgi:uncharacterized protein GlcG (DUF336 family)